MWHRLDDSVRHGDNLRWLSEASRLDGQGDEAKEYGRCAIQVLERQGKRRELARAYGNQSQLHMYANELAPALQWGRKAILLARRVGDVEAESHARSCVGTARVQSGDLAGMREIERGLALAGGAQLEELVASAWTTTCAALVTMRDLPRANVALAEAIAYTSARGVDVWHDQVRGYQAVARLHGGQLAEAVDVSLDLLARPSLSTISQIHPLTVLGRARARRGDPAVWEPLDQALALAERTQELQWIGPVRVARGEAAWLAGDAERARREVKAALPFALRLRAPWIAGELVFVLALAGERCKPPPWLLPPFSLHLRGQFAAAAKAWSTLGCPYEHAWSLAGDDSESGLRTAFEILERLGMVAAAGRAADRLRSLGVRRIPRGRRASTVANAAGLTNRELDVLALVAEGLTNVEIGKRLFVSPKTVNHHVSAILRKVDAINRVAAARWYLAWGSSFHKIGHRAW